MTEQEFLNLNTFESKFFLKQVELKDAYTEIERLQNKIKNLEQLLEDK